MKVALIIGLCAFLSSLFGCLQVINLNHGWRWRGALVSCCIGTCQLTIYKLAQEVHGPLQVGAFLLGGVLGMQLSFYYRKTP